MLTKLKNILEEQLRQGFHNSMAQTYINVCSSALVVDNRFDDCSDIYLDAVSFSILQAKRDLQTNYQWEHLPCISAIKWLLLMNCSFVNFTELNLILLQVFHLKMNSCIPFRSLLRTILSPGVNIKTKILPIILIKSKKNQTKFDWKTKKRILDEFFKNLY